MPLKCMKAVLHGMEQRHSYVDWLAGFSHSCDYFPLPGDLLLDCNMCCSACARSSLQSDRKERDCISRCLRLIAPLRKSFSVTGAGTCPE